MEYYCRRQGWEIKGKELQIEISGLKYQRQSLYSLSNRNTLFEPMIYQNMANTEFMIAYFNNTLPKLPPNSVVIMDNASWHKSKQLQELFDYYQVELKFQPPYCPDTNPIEQLWGIIKRLLRSYFNTSLNLFDNLCFIISELTGELKSLGMG
jgi:transposase